MIANYIAVFFIREREAFLYINFNLQDMANSKSKNEINNYLYTYSKSYKYNDKKMTFKNEQRARLIKLKFSHYDIGKASNR